MTDESTVQEWHDQESTGTMTSEWTDTEIVLTREEQEYKEHLEKIKKFNNVSIETNNSIKTIKENIDKIKDNLELEVKILRDVEMLHGYIDCIESETRVILNRLHKDLSDLHRTINGKINQM